MDISYAESNGLLSGSPRWFNVIRIDEITDLASLFQLGSGSHQT